MTDAKAVIKDFLIEDSVIRELLPNRKSIYPMGKLVGDSKMPAVMLQDGPIINIDENLMQNDIYIRIYDDPEMGTINIYEIGNRIFEILHNKRLPLEHGQFIKCKFNNTTGELEDQSLHKRFVEYQYRILSI